MQGLLTSLGGLRAVSFHDGFTVEAAGITSDSTRVEVDLVGGQKVVVALGSESGAGQVYGQVDGGSIVSIRASVAQNIARLLPKV